MHGFVDAATGMVRFEATVDGVAFSVSVRADGSVALARVGEFDPVGDRECHDRFLAERLGDGAVPWKPESHPYGGIEWRYPWGMIGSYLYPQDQIAQILIAYR